MNQLDREVVSVVEDGAAVRFVERVVDVVRSASRRSMVLDAACAASRAWTRQSIVDRTSATGVLLIAAAAVHLALVFWQGLPAGWLWLVVPMLAIAFGLLMTLAPARGLRRQVER